MKIALVCKNYFSTKGGLERYTIYLSRELARKGHEVHVFANAWQQEQGIVFHHVPVFPFSSPGKNLSFAYFCSRELAKIQFDVVQSMERIFCQDIYRSSDGINPMQMKLRYPNPLVRSLKAMGPRRRALGYLERRIFSEGGCKRIIALSQMVKRDIIAHYGTDPHKIEVIYNGVDISRFHPGVMADHRQTIRKAHGIGGREVVLLFVSNNHKLKNLRLILRAMLLLKKKARYKLLVLGDDNHKPYQKFAYRRGLHGQVLFLGPRRHIERYYAASDIFVFPSRYDTFANVCLESMACGLPLIASNTCGASELIQEGVNGYVLKTQQPHELADKISAVEEKSDRKRMGQAAAETAKVFTMERHLSQLFKLYEKLAAL
jgi:UDP-glucose:(heptosyl)LPS alpha-1,3-glucosyltransferase